MLSGMPLLIPKYFHYSFKHVHLYILDEIYIHIVIKITNQININHCMFKIRSDFEIYPKYKKYGY